MQHAMLYIQYGGQDSEFESRAYSPIHQAAHTDTYKNT